MNSTQNPRDLFSRFVNWLNDLGTDAPTTNKVDGGEDFFSKLMNRISN